MRTPGASGTPDVVLPQRSQAPGQYSSASLEPLEPFVDAAKAAEFLCLRPRRVLELARQGLIPAYPVGDGRRRVWRFRLLELASAIRSRGVDYARQSAAPK
jgi:hypothetical protein